MNLAGDGQSSVRINNLEIAQADDIGLAIDYEVAQSLRLFGYRALPAEPHIVTTVTAAINLIGSPF